MYLVELLGWGLLYMICFCLWTTRYYLLFYSQDLRNICFYIYAVCIHCIFFRIPFVSFFENQIYICDRNVVKYVPLSVWIYLNQGDITLPSREDMWNDINMKVEAVSQRYVNSSRHTMQEDYIDFMDQLSGLIGCKPNFGAYLCVCVFVCDFN